MNYLDLRLGAIAQQSLAVCRSVSDALAEAFSERDGRGGVSLSLQSRYGTLVSFPERQGRTGLDLCSHPLLEPLASGENEERIALLLGSETWYMVSCFSLSGIAFYPVVSIPAPPEHLRWVRYELLGALDCFHLKCRETIASFLQGMTSGPRDTAVKRGAPEKQLLATLTAYSERIESAALIDTDGFVLMAAGIETSAEATAGMLALFNQQALRNLQALGAMDIVSLSVGGGNRTCLMGRISESGVSFACAVRGDHAHVVGRFLFDAVLAAVPSLRNAPDTLGDYRKPAGAMPLTVRDGWLSPPRLVPQAAFVSLEGGGVFHDPTCTKVIEHDAQKLRWHATRADTIRAGLAPCTVCNP